MSSIASCMRYFESVYDRHISKLPLEAAPDPKTKLHYNGDNDRYNNRFDWKYRQKRKIKSLARKGVSHDEIANMFGCSQQTISRLLKEMETKCTTTSSKSAPRTLKR